MFTVIIGKLIGECKGSDGLVNIALDFISAILNLFSIDIPYWELKPRSLNSIAAFDCEMFLFLKFLYSSASEIPILVFGRENSGINAWVLEQLRHLILIMLILLA